MVMTCHPVREWVAFGDKAAGSLQTLLSISVDEELSRLSSKLLTRSAWLTRVCRKYSTLTNRQAFRLGISLLRPIS
jgi:hypothetical protein